MAEGGEAAASADMSTGLREGMLYSLDGLYFRLRGLRRRI